MSPLANDANRRFEFAKALLARAKASTSDEERKNFSEAAISIAFSSLEGMLSEVFSHFSKKNDFSIFEQSIINEKSVRILKGEPTLGEQRFQSIEDRLQYLFWRFSGAQFDTGCSWWPAFAEAVQLRNSIMHPKVGANIDPSDAERALNALLLAIDALMFTVFKKRWPKARKGLSPSVTI
jgi:hypothetical protein